jgi:hypothetical protein
MVSSSVGPCMVDTLGLTQVLYGPPSESACLRTLSMVNLPGSTKPSFMIQGNLLCSLVEAIERLLDWLGWRCRNLS